MSVFLIAILILLVSGTCSLLTSKSTKLCDVFGLGGVLLGCVLGLVLTLQVLQDGTPLTFQAAWGGPFGTFDLKIDSLSAFFLLPIFGLSALCGIYGCEYLTPYASHKHLGGQWFFFTLLVASMAVVVASQNGLLFLIAWEIMALSSFCLVVFEGEKESVRDAGIMYLIATHLGTAFLLVFFILLGKEAGSFEFSHFVGLKNLSPAVAGTLFVFAVIGFGTKAGLMPFHVWLPEAHPAAPSHVSALMSGVMIKTGIYGILRSLTFVGPPEAWWGWLLVSVGLLSGIVGILFALAQHDLKRMLAYSSIENIGIIAVGLGLGLVGVTSQIPVLAVLGFSGALFHVLNHAVFKGLLFLAAGSVVYSTHTHEMDELGGLFKKMPWTGAAFLVGAIAISGLPPFNGFMSEFLIYLGAFEGALSKNPQAALPCLLSIIGLALIGGLAVATFTRAFGIIFQGHFRGKTMGDIHDAGPSMRMVMVTLASGCLVIGLGAFVLMEKIFSISNFLLSNLGFPSGLPPPNLESLSRISIVGTILLLFVVALLGLRKRLLSKRGVSFEVTWDCGYVAPSSRMQYTASSFAQPILQLFHMIVRHSQKFTAPTGYFPSRGSSTLSSTAPDRFHHGLYYPLFRWVERKLSFLRRFQHGRMQVYILFIAVTLLVLLVWQLGALG